jgi:hypothetical protein
VIRNWHWSIAALAVMYSKDLLEGGEVGGIVDVVVRMVVLTWPTGRPL